MNETLFKIRYLVFNLCMAWCCLSVFDLQAATFMQSNVVSGVVKDNTGVGMPGVNVFIKGEAKGTSTDADGKFSIQAGSSSTLVFSFIGYLTTEEVVGSRTFIDVTMAEDALTLSEVVVVGYGTQQRATLTGSVSDVKGAEILKSPSPNISNNLAGRISGVISTNNSGEPGNDDPNLIIRGLSTFSDTPGANAPLIVIDGVANRPGGFSRLNANDIESISVLKDASAAIYGAQAANGVILVTTKKGKSGQTQISLNYNQGFNTWVKFPRMTSSYEFATLLNEENLYTGEDPIFTEAELQKYQDGSDPISYPNTDWVNEVAKDVTLQNSLNLALSGGNEKATYYGSYGRVHQDGQFQNSNTYQYTQNNLALKLGLHVHDNFEVSFETQLRYTERDGPAGSSTQSLPSSYGSDGTDALFSGLLFSLPNQVARYPDGKLGSTNPITHQNPLALTTGLAGMAEFRDLFALNTFRYKLALPQLLEGLFFDGFVSVDFQASQSKDFGKAWLAYSFDPTTETYTPIQQTASAEGLASLDQYQYDQRVFTFHSKLNYQTTFDKHAVSSFVAFEQQKYNDNAFYAGRRNFVTDNISELDYGSPVNATNGGGSSNTARRNYFGRINYAYDEKYLIEVQGRYDGSDKFPEDKRWGFFPSVSLGWRLGAEPWAASFMKGNELKVRASYGLLGNDRIAPYQFLQFYDLNTSGYYLNGKQVPTLRPGVLPNPNFTWETAESINLAVDGSVWNKSFTYTVEVFRQTRDDILYYRNATVPNYTGLELPIENIGKMENKGLEMTLSYRHQFGDVVFTTGGNFTYTKNKVIFQDEPESIPEYQRQSGRSLNSQILYKADGLFQSQADIDDYVSRYDYQVISPDNLRPGDVKFVDYNRDGAINDLDQIRFDGNEQPTKVFGLSIGAEWKGLDVSVLFQGQAGTRNHFYPLVSSTLNAYHFLYEGRSTPGNVTDQPTTAGASYARPAFYGSTHPFFLRNTSFVRLKNLEIGYSLKKLIGPSVKISNARVYVNASNLLTFAKFSDVDPESINVSDGRGYPILRTYNIGAQLTF